MAFFKATKKSRAAHYFGGHRGVIQRFLRSVAPSQARILLGLCWLWYQVCGITAELFSWNSCISFRSLWVFSCLPPSWCWSLKVRQKCLMCLSLKTSTSSHGIMGIRAQSALKMPHLWLVCIFVSGAVCLPSYNLEKWGEGDQLEGLGTSSQELFNP